MAAPIIEFFWDVTSPYTYLASTQIEEVAARHGAKLQWRPFLLGGVFKSTNNKPPADNPYKVRYMLRNLQHWADYLGVPFRFPENFPIMSLLPMRTAVAADRDGRGPAYAKALMQAYWVEGVNLADPETLRATADAAGFDGAELIAAAETPEVKDALKAATAEAVQRGAFGAPTFFVGDELFWGNDNIVLLDAYLQRRR